VVLRHYAGLSEQETAGAPDVSVGTVKSQTHVHRIGQATVAPRYKLAGA
jgi:DNA-directed RNA polymerase specialized sigma24 family protein